MTLKQNTIYCGDNLPILKGFEDESVDLCYIDPPFFTSKQYEVIWKDGAEKRAFDDRWVKMGDNGRYSKDMNVYLDFMEPRIGEIYRVLKSTGSFYLHCDYHADAHLRLFCDKTFKRPPLNIITWKRQSPSKATKDNYPRISDTILFYSKSDKYTFNTQYIADDVEKFSTLERETGRMYETSCLSVVGSQEGKVFDIGDKKYMVKKGMALKWSQETINERLKNNPFIIHWTSSGEPRYKRYADEYRGIPVSSIWTDISLISSTSKERLGYPTQKPEALLERIINTSSNVGDIVLDAFCGCGTTLAVARLSMRSWVGIDISPTACRTIATRIRYPFKDIIGIPMSADDVAALTGYEFQNAVIRFLDPTLETIKVNCKGADGGIDGSYHGLLISVKKYKAGRKDLDEFIGMLNRNNRKRGMFIALEYSSDFIKEVARLGRENKIAIYPFTLAEIIAEKHKSLTRKEDKAHGKL
jgi:DNA modification methylase